MSRVFRWLFERRLDKAIENMEKHMTAVEDTINSVYMMVRAWKDGKIDETNRFFHSAKSSEKNADNLRRETARILSGGSGEDALERTFLLRLMGRIDRIADWAVEFARILEIIKYSDVPEEAKNVLYEFTLKLVEISSKTFEMIKKLRESSHEALRLADEVEGLEEDIDAYFAEARRKMVKSLKGYDPPIVYLIYMSLEALENSSDACEDSSDIVREIIVRLGS
ncbi:MAG: hypothetical protein DRJ35_04750 [Thermoprotei archaeon]|nr:MAG: hypothetical protein DRJ35_04750 [Thermoprotei archaeon]